MNWQLQAFWNSFRVKKKKDFDGIILTGEEKWSCGGRQTLHSTRTGVPCIASRESFIKFVHKVLINYLYVFQLPEISVAQSNQKQPTL